MNKKYFISNFDGLYECLGYQDAHFGEYTERGEYLDPQGRHHIWEEICIYLIKDLRARA